MQRTLLPLFLTLLSYSGLTSGLCILQNGTVARCHELEDVKYIKTYDLDSLKTSIEKSILHPGFFVNLTSLRHLDLSGGAIKQIGPGSFSQLMNLRSLNLAENRIEHLELGSLDGLNHLHSLNLRKNNLRHLPPALARLKILKHLDVQGNPLQCDCATLKVRDLIAKRGVKVSKKVFCANPRNVKGTSLYKLDTAVICHFEEQDREMQNDQAYKDSLEDYGSGDLFDKEDDSMEYVIEGSTMEAPKLENETSFSEISVTTELSREVTATTEEQELPIQTTETVKSTTSTDDEIFFDSEEKIKLTTVDTTTERKKVHEDGLFYPTEGSGDEEDGSGEGSGTGVDFGEQVYQTDNDKKEGSFFEGLYDLFIGSTKPSEEPNLEEEQFIDASSTKGIEEEESLVNKTAVEKEIVPMKVDLDETVSGTTEVAIKTTSRPTSRVELIDNELHDMTKLGNVKMDEEDTEDGLAVSSAKQSKKGMGSYVVLAALLAILATLIGFAAYKGDFCRKRRKRSDVENGTELRDMQKALLETGNSTTQPKIASNGNVENAPLVEDATDHDEIKSSNDYRVTAEIPKSPNGTSGHAELLKPPRAATPQNDQKIKETIDQDEKCPKDDSLQTNSVDPVINSSPNFRLAEENQPPLSPGAQRVKITLQENPDSVPRTPILITRTAAGENLVKTP
ncbi:unnamed protein product [Heterotrigona itama]|uniref:LRRCT domain-containing protein n=1 Tax=Heterotrigona itama TaxID=395501 RepID=A0A6V7GUT4_9HYME|nr:unnamed protein product [Heterotrigona itama]